MVEKMQKQESGTVVGTSKTNSTMKQTSVAKQNRKATGANVRTQATTESKLDNSAKDIGARRKKLLTPANGRKQQQQQQQQLTITSILRTNSLPIDVNPYRNMVNSVNSLENRTQKHVSFSEKLEAIYDSKTDLNCNLTI